VTTSQAVKLWEQITGEKAVDNKRQLFSYHAKQGNFHKWALQLDPPLQSEPALKFPNKRSGVWFIHKRLIEYMALHPPKPGGSPDSGTAAWNKSQVLKWIKEENLQSRREMAKRLGVVPESISRYLDQLINEGKITRDEKGQLAIVLETI
jgi:hypothetical protein